MYINTHTHTHTHTHIYIYIYIYIPTNIYLLKVNNRNTRKRCEMCSKLTIKTPERGQ